MSIHDNDLERLIAKCEHWYGLASARQRALGHQWYPDAHVFCLETADAYRTDIRIVAGVLAALSPAVYWDLNKRQAEALVQAYASGGRQMADKVVLSTYGKQAVKAKDILDLPRDEPESDTELEQRILNILAPGPRRRAWKTRAFYLSILHTDYLTVCIDRHIISAMGFSDRWVAGARWCYALVQNAFLHAAEKIGIAARDLQAIIWITYKETAEAYSPAERGVQQAVRTLMDGESDLPV